MTREPDAVRHSRPAIATAIVAAPLLVLAYPLSLGPVLWLVDDGWISGVHAIWITRFYVPLEWLYDSTEWFAALMDWYLAWWRVH